MKILFATRTTVMLVAAAMLVATTLAAQQDAKPSAEQQAMMDAWMKYAMPGDNHKLLEPFVGSWNAKVTMWQSPSAPPAVSAGTSENTWVLGGRFLQQNVTGQMMGQPFSGIGYTGYDNYKKQFIGSWMDSMGTMMMISTGTADAAGKVLTFTSRMDDVMTGKSVAVREVTRVIDHDHHVFEMYGPDEKGNEFKTMEIAYTRK